MKSYLLEVCKWGFNRTLSKYVWTYERTNVPVFSERTWTLFQQPLSQKLILHICSNLGTRDSQEDYSEVFRILDKVNKPCCIYVTDRMVWRTGPLACLSPSSVWDWIRFRLQPPKVCLVWFPNKRSLRLKLNNVFIHCYSSMKYLRNWWHLCYSSVTFVCPLF